LDDLSVSEGIRTFMTFIPPGLSAALWRIVPAPLRSKLRSDLVKRFVRFAPAAVCAVAATQVTYIVCLGVLDLTAGISGFLGWLAGAAVSYVISRWAWERKGRPHLLKETLPFVAVSLGAGIVLTLASKLGNQVALSMGLDGAAQVVVADIFYFGANCLTFALRFVIFHYLLFADRRSSADVLAMVEGRELPWAAEPAVDQRAAQGGTAGSPDAAAGPRGAAAGPRGAVAGPAAGPRDAAAGPRDAAVGAGRPERPGDPEAIHGAAEAVHGPDAVGHGPGAVGHGPDAVGPEAVDSGQTRLGSRPVGRSDGQPAARRVMNGAPRPAHRPGADRPALGAQR
jgi:putative flippase GtrA